jgi:hypothetical protein
MTTQEQQMLQGLADRINRTQLQDKDPDAEQFIQQNLGRNPDAMYILAQTVLVQEYALGQAQKQLADLRAQLDQARQHAQEPKHSGSFLGNLLGLKDEPQRAAPPPPAPPPAPAAAPGAPQPQYGAPPPQYPSAGYGPGLAYPAGGYPIPGPPQGGGFLRSAMQTATGVAAGALAFEGIESLMHGFGHSAGYGEGLGGFGGSVGGRPEEVINNYYGDASPHEHGGDSVSDVHERQEGFTDHPADSSQVSTASDAGDGAKLQDASYAPANPDDGGANADDLSGTADTDYSANADDSMLSDDVGDDQGFDSGDDSGGDDSGGDFDSGGNDDGGF